MDNGRPFQSTVDGKGPKRRETVGESLARLFQGKSEEAVGLFRCAFLALPFNLIDLGDGLGSIRELPVTESTFGLGTKVVLSKASPGSIFINSSNTGTNESGSGG